MNKELGESISIIIPTYNMRRQLARCFDALIRQTMKPDEVIVVDDGSTDGTAEFAEAYHGLPIRFIRQEHAGAAAARNRGFVISKGEYVIFLDADVVLKKHAIERLYDVLRSYQTIFSAPRSSRHDALPPQKSPGLASFQSHEEGRGGVLSIGYAYSSFRWGWKKFSSFPFDAERLKQMPYIHTTSLIRREALAEKPFDESLKRLQDWDLYLSLLERGYQGAYVPEVLFTVETRGTMSRWLPSIMYQIPFGKLGIKFERMEKYREAEQIVRMKHGLHLSRSSS